MSAREPSSRALYPGLNGGRGGPGAAAVARHQRGRLMGAMVEAVSQHGYAGTTVGELVALAGVSKSTFYQHFESKEECFLATFDAAAVVVREQMEAARGSRDTPASRLEAALAAFAQGMAEHPKVAKLMTVESFVPGAAAIPHRNSFLAHLEGAVADALPANGDAGPNPLPRAVAGGLCHAAYACMRDGRPDGLIEGRDELIAWALSYRDAPPPLAAAGQPLEEAEPTPTEDRRGLIAKAAVEIAAERGYSALTIPMISARASISNQTFYEHFASKEEAFLAGFDLLTADVRRAMTAAFEAADDWPRGIAAATRSLLERISTDPLLAAAAVFELPTLGAQALASRGLIRNSLGSLLRSAASGAEPGQAPSPLVLEAIVGGIATVIQFEIAAGREAELPALLPVIAQVAVTPFDRAEGRARPGSPIGPAVTRSP